MQLPPNWPAWRAAVFNVFLKYRIAISISFVVLSIGIISSVPATRTWAIMEAGQLGLLSPPEHSIELTSSAAPTTDPLQHLQSSIDQITAGETALQATRQEDKVQLQTLLSQLQETLAQIDSSSSELEKLVGLPSTVKPPPTAKTPTPITTKVPTTSSKITTPPSIPSAVPDAPPPTEKPSGIIHINSATIEELESLPDIGPSYAQKIIAYRIQHGGFKQIEELQDVKGIGSAKMAKLRSLIEL